MVGVAQRTEACSCSLALAYLKAIIAQCGSILTSRSPSRSRPSSGLAVAGPKSANMLSDEVSYWSSTARRHHHRSDAIVRNWVESGLAALHVSRDESRQSVNGPTKDLAMGLAPAKAPDLLTAQLQYHFDSEMVVASKITRTASSG